MNFFADESVDRPIVERLRQQRHEVLYVAEIFPSISDDMVLDRANALDAILLTADKDFGDLVYRQGRIHAGVTLIRLAGLSPEAKAHIVSTTVSNRGGELAGAFSVITPAAIRIRRRF